MTEKARKIKNPVTFILLLVAIPAVVLGGTFLFREKHYAFPSIAVAVLSCIPLFYTFERKESKAGELIVIAVLVAISALGRFLFAWLPSFKPVAAIVIVVGIYLGKEPGFVVGSLSAVVSNFYFGQGPWTPFQMFAWGFIGFMAGVLSGLLKKNRIVLAVFGALAGLLYSLLMDVWTVVWADETFNLSRYAAAVATSFVVMIEYAVSNVLFLILLARPIGDALLRIKKKYGLFVTESAEKKDNEVAVPTETEACDPDGKPVEGGSESAANEREQKVNLNEEDQKISLNGENQQASLNGEDRKENVIEGNQRT